MNDIGFGIMCFGNGYYYREAKKKERKILDAGFDCMVLTDLPGKFQYPIYYDRVVKSYHDKMNLVRNILNFNEICILLDADTEILDYSFLDDLKDYEFKKGITYLDTLFNHPENKCYVNELNSLRPEWNEYFKYTNKIYPDFGDLTLMWEYFIVFNPTSVLDDFYGTYEKLQIVKEFCDIRANKEILGNGEGVSIAIASEIANEPCYQDLDLYNLIGNKMSNRSVKYARDDS